MRRRYFLKPDLELICPPGRWSVSTRKIAGRQFYVVYRICYSEAADSEVVCTRGGYYDTRREAEKLARLLNEEERGDCRK